MGKNVTVVIADECVCRQQWLKLRHVRLGLLYTLLQKPTPSVNKNPHGKTGTL